MKLKHLIILISIFQYSIGFSQNEVVIGKVDHLDSKILNEKRTIWVHLPENFNSSKRYPVVYLLDASVQFHSVTGLINHFSYSNMNTLCPEMIVVGILNTDRTRDLTPYKPNPIDSMMPPQFLEGSGGGENFISFLEKELIPYVESKYPTAPYRLFIGHSFGGLTVLHTFLHYPELFDAYIALDPTTNWVRGRILQEFEAAALDTKKFDRKVLFLGNSNIDIGKDLNESLSEDDFIADNLKSQLAIEDFLHNHPLGQLRFHSKFYPDEMHTTVPLIATYDALRFIFDYYNPSLTMKDFLNPESSVAKSLEDHYKEVSLRLGYEVLPEEGFVNMMGYQFLSLDHLKKAEDLFLLNIKLYPDSANTYDSLGDYYMAAGENEKAIASFKKALSLGNSEQTKQKLEALTAN